jgi:uncharacterized repeat protein (TIGR04138 family)
MTPNEQPFWDAVDQLRGEEPRYRREAYGFLVAALGTTVQSLPPERLGDPQRRHLTGQELLSGIVALARREFGAMAPTVFREWGIRRSEDWGAIVFELVEAGQLSARPEDRLEDFSGGPDLLEALAADVERSDAAPRGESPPRESGPSAST